MCQPRASSHVTQNRMQLTCQHTHLKIILDTGMQLTCQHTHLKIIFDSSAHSCCEFVRNADPVVLIRRIRLNWLKITPTYRLSRVKAHTKTNPTNLRTDGPSMPYMSQGTVSW